MVELELWFKVYCWTAKYIIQPALTQTKGLTALKEVNVFMLGLQWEIERVQTAKCDWHLLTECFDNRELANLAGQYLLSITFEQGVSFTCSKNPSMIWQSVNLWHMEFNRKRFIAVQAEPPLIVHINVAMFYIMCSHKLNIWKVKSLRQT